MLSKQSIITAVRKNVFLWKLVRRVRPWVNPIISQPISGWFKYWRFFGELRRFNEAGGHARVVDAFPCLSDRTSETNFDPQYFYQAYWGAEKIYAHRPAVHVDVGSDVKFIAMLSALTHVKFVDIRPLQATLPSLESLSGTIVDLPFEDESIDSLSSLHVIEHVGLGRYGDPLDPEGSEKACLELKRVLAPGGYLYVSFPVGTPRVQFNGHRIFSREEVTGLFEGLTLEHAALIDNHGSFVPDADISTAVFDEVRGQDFALGCFVFRKESSS